MKRLSELASIVATLQRETMQSEPIRDGYGHAVVQAAEYDERVVVLSADLTESTRNHWFAERFPHRFFQVGIAEQNLAVIASGMAAAGKVPFIASYAAFSPGRNNEQIRTNICLNNMPVKIVGAHAGVSVGPDGATHQALEDIGLMRMLPRMQVIVPCDSIEAGKATLAIAATSAPSYLRLAREKTPVITLPETPFAIGQALILRDGDDVAIVACGTMVYEALVAAEMLEKHGIQAMVINNHTIKPLDDEAILRAAKKCNAMVTAEEHQVAGGMGSAVAELLAQHHPIAMEYVGIRDRFGESGTPSELMAAFGLDAHAIVQAARRVIARKS